MTDYYKINVDSLSRRYPTLLNHLSHFSGEPPGILLPTQTLPTLQLKEKTGQDMFVYNPENPLGDIAAHLKMVEGDGAGQSCVFIGMGLGYGPLTLLREKSRINQIIICEPCPEIFHTAMIASDLRPLILSEKSFFFIGEPDWDEFRRQMAVSAGDKIHFMNLAPLFHWKPDRYVPLNQKAYEVANQISVISATAAHNSQTTFDNMLGNLTLSAHAFPAESLRGSFKNKPALLISAGPSLTESIPDIRNAVGKCVIIAVDSALKPLMAEGIFPDFVTTIDFNEINFEKLAPFIDNEHPSYSLVYEISVCPMIPKKIPARHLFYAFQNNQSQEWVRKALNVKSTFSDCMTVAHLSLGLALLIEASPIIFVGQDLAYTSEKSTHAAGTVFFSGGIFPEEYIVPVTGINGEVLRTHRGFLAFKTGFETIIRTYPGTYINASARGAHIVGTTVLSLEEVTRQYLTESISPEEIIASVMGNQSGDRNGDPLIRECGFMLEQIVAKTKWVKDTWDQVKKIQRKIHSREKDLVCITGPDELPPDINGEIVKLNGLKKHSDRMAFMNDLFYSTALEIDRRVTENRRTMSKNYLEGVKEILEIMIFENQKHLDLLEEYRKQVSHLSKYLEQEKRYESGLHGGSGLTDLIALYCESGNYLLAENLIPSLIKTEQNLSPQLLFFLGVSKYERFKFDEGEKLFQQAIRLLPSIEDQVFAYKDQSAEALFDKIQKGFGPVNEWLRRFRAVTYGMGRRAEALEFLKQAVSAMPNQDSLQSLLAGWLLETGKFDDGLRHLKEAVRLNPKNAFLWEEIGDALYDSSDYESALIAYENWFIALPQTPDGLRKMGDCYLKMRQPHAAIEAYENVLKMNETDLTARTRLKEARTMVQ